MYRDEKRSWMKHLDFTILDMLMMELALILAYGWRFEHAWLFNHELYVRIAVIALLIDVCVVFFSEAYTGILRRNKYQELRSTVTHCAVFWYICMRQRPLWSIPDRCSLSFWDFLSSCPILAGWS